MTISINSLTISGSEITIGYDNNALTGQGYFYRIAGEKAQDYKSLNHSSLSYVIDFWGNTLFPLKSGDTDYSNTPFYKYPINSKDMNAMNLLGSPLTSTSIKKTLFCVGGVHGFDIDSIYDYFKTPSGKKVIESYDGIVFDIEKLYSAKTDLRYFFSYLWYQIRTLCEMWNDKYKIFCVISTGCATNFNQDYSYYKGDKKNFVGNFIRPMYEYISDSSNNAYLAPMLYSGGSTNTYYDYTFVKGISVTIKGTTKSYSISDEYTKYKMNKSLLPIIFDNDNIDHFYKSSENKGSWKWTKSNNYMIWPSNPKKLKANPIYFSPDCPYDFSGMFCPHKDKKTPVKGTCTFCGKESTGNLRYCSNISPYCENPTRPPFECAAKTYTIKSGDACYNLIKSLYPHEEITPFWQHSIALNNKSATKSNAKYCSAVNSFISKDEKVAIWKNGENHTSNTSYIHFAKQDTNFKCSNYQTPNNNVYILTDDENKMKACTESYTKDDILLICPKSTPLPPNGVACNCFECGYSTPRTYGICPPATKSCDVKNGDNGCYTNAPSSCDCSTNAYIKSADKINQSRWKCKSSTNPLKATCVECSYYDLSCPYATKNNCENVCQLRSTCDNYSAKGKSNPTCKLCDINDETCSFTNILNNSDTQCNGHCFPKSGNYYYPDIKNKVCHSCGTNNKYKGNPCNPYSRAYCESLIKG